MSNPTPAEFALRKELREAREQLAALAERIDYLQTANERMYRAEYERAGGPSFDPMQPFGTLSAYRHLPPPRNGFLPRSWT